MNINTQSETAKTATTDQSLNDLALKMLEARGLKDLEQSQINLLQEDMVEAMKSAINIAIFKELSEDKLKEFENILDTKPETEVQEYCQQNIPNLEQVVSTALTRFTEVYFQDKK